MAYNTNILLKGAKLIAENDMTVRQAANIIGVSKSALHKYCQTELQYDSTSLYWKVKDKMEGHLATRHLKGGEATKKIWETKKAAKEFSF